MMKLNTRCIPGAAAVHVCVGPGLDSIVHLCGEKMHGVYRTKCGIPDFDDQAAKGEVR